MPNPQQQVHFDQWLILPAAMRVHGARDELFPRSGLAINNDVRIRRPHRRRSLEHFSESGRSTDDLVEVVLRPDLLSEVNVLRVESFFQRRYFRKSST